MMEIPGISWGELIGIWVGATLTIFVFSFLYKDNFLYKFAEHLYVGVSVGYSLTVLWHNIFLPNILHPLVFHWKGGLMRLGMSEEELYETARKMQEAGTIDKVTDLTNAHLYLVFTMLLASFLGMLYFARYIKGYAWMSRWPIAIVIGYGAGLAMVMYTSQDLVAQVEANIIPLFRPGCLDAFQSSPGVITFLGLFSNLLMIIGLLASLVYFFFSVEHKGIVGRSARLGVWFLMVAFGASFGYTIMGRVSLLIGRFQYLMQDWLPTIGISLGS